jgi:hypothetical protein
MGANVSMDAGELARAQWFWERRPKKLLLSTEGVLREGPDIQLQEESVNLWKDLPTKLGSPEEFQAKFESMMADAFPKARERMEEFVETFNRTSKQTIDLFEKTLSVYQATSVTDAQLTRARSDRELAGRSADQRSERPEHER